MSKMGSEMGSGNPPGKYSGDYLNPSEGMHEDFTASASYRGSMSVGRNDSATVVGNQPKENRTFTLESQDNKENPLS